MFSIGVGGCRGRRAGDGGRAARFQGALLESRVIKLLSLLLSGAKLGKLFASGGTMLVAVYFRLAACLALMAYRTHGLISPAAS